MWIAVARETAAKILRRLGSLGGWVKRRLVVIASVITGFGATLTTWWDADEFSLKVVVIGIVFGAIAGLPAWIIERKMEEMRVNRVKAEEEKAQRKQQTRQQQFGQAADHGSTFRGREAELADLIVNHDRERAARDNGGAATTGPVVLPVHGPPGVGKSFLAAELASRLAAQYPDGVFSENFGKGGGPAPPAELLKKFLTGLEPERDIPAGTVERANLFRSLTAGKRMLFIFDAARNHDQVLSVLPAEPGCAVIITSRQDLSSHLGVDNSGLYLGVPSLADALEILSARAGINWRTRAEKAIEVVQLCGLLPRAIVSAAERVSLDHTDLRHVADLLRSPSTRLDGLEHGGYSVRERFDSEYRRLSPRQQRAFCMLTLVPSPTFVPWVLVPVADVVQSEAENMMAALGQVQLLDNAGTDAATGLARYRFNPLVRLFAMEKLADHAPVGAVGNALADRYVELADDCLSHLHPEEYQRITQAPAPASAVSRFVVEHPEKTVRIEYHNIARLVLIARERGHLDMCWRAAAMLRGCVPPEAGEVDPIDAFTVAMEAARAVGNHVGELDVKLALASFLVAIEKYDPAFAILFDIAENELDDSGKPDSAGDFGTEQHLRRVRAKRKIAEAYMQMGAYEHADVNLRDALEHAQRSGEREETKLIRHLIADTYCIPSPDTGYADLEDGRHLHDPFHYRTLLGHSEVNRRREVWLDAEEDLLKAHAHSLGDARRMASVQYRLARLYVGWWRSIMPGFGFGESEGETDPAPAGGDSDDQRDLPHKAIRCAAEAVLLFRTMGNSVGVARAQCLLARALLTAGQTLAAEQLLLTVQHSLHNQPLTTNPALPTLLARYSRAHGEMLLRNGEVSAARQALTFAATRYESNQDWTSHSEIWTLLEWIRENRHDPVPSRTA